MNISIIHHLINGTLSPSEREELKGYVADLRTKEEFYNLFDSVWAECGNESSMPAHLQDRIYNELMSQIKAPETVADVDRGARNIFRSAGLWRVVAACVVVLLATVCGWLYKHSSENMGLPAGNTFTVSAERGQRADLLLPDGTHVWLNSDSRLTYSVAYGVSERRVELEGEANFKVAKDSVRPFVVDAMGVSTEVLGTEFNIRAYSGSDSYSVALYEGSLRVEYGGESSVLVPKDELKIIFPEGEVIKTHDESLGTEPAWKRNELVFNGESLSEIAEVIRRTFATEVVITDESLAQERFVGTVNNTSVSNFIDIIGLTTPITYYFEGDTLFIARKE